MKRLAILGAGLAGVTIAQRLSAFAEVSLFEKSRGYGGRMATRRANGFEWDHGAQYFTARSMELRAVVETTRSLESVAAWEVEIPEGRASRPHTPEPRFVGRPGMSSFVGALAHELDARFETEISAITGEPGDWRLSTSAGEELNHYDLVVSAVPAPQAIRLMPPVFSGHAAMATVRMSGCFTLMLGLHEQPAFAASAFRPVHPLLSWVAVNSSKPGRRGGVSIVAHSRNDWADAHLEEHREAVKAAMLAALQDITGRNFADARDIRLHRWRYANVETALGQPYLLDRENGLASAGDWCLGGRVECAFESGRLLSDALIEMVA